MTELIIDVLKDVVIDTAKLLPFLFVTYLVMEYLERKTEDRSAGLLARSGKWGPLPGALTGILPQCGFSAAASSLYAGGVITVGTLLAVFLSTSDEMLAIFLSSAVPVTVIAKVLFTKVLLGTVSGFAVDFGWRRAKKIFRRPGHMRSASRKDSPDPDEKHIHDLCKQEHCGCEDEGSIWKSAAVHTAHILSFIFLISLVITFLVELAGEEAIAGALSGKPVLGVFLAGLIGLIPNCAASVTITSLYLEGILDGGQMIAGLLVGAGVGLLVLFRTNRHLKENAVIAAALYAIGVFWGLVLEMLHVAF